MKLLTLFLFFSVTITTSPLLGMTADEKAGVPAGATLSVDELAERVEHVNFHESDDRTDPSINNKSEPADAAGDTKSTTPPAIDEKEVMKHFSKCFRQVSSGQPRDCNNGDFDAYRNRISEFLRIFLTCMDNCFKYARENKLEVEVTIKLVALSIKDLKKLKLEDPSGRGKTVLHQAAADGNVNAVKTLLLAGAKVDSRDDHPFDATPLHFAAQYGHNEVCKILLEYKANVNAQGEQNRTPLHEAAQRRHENVCKTLIKAGAKRHARDLFGHIPNC